jgi:hypothetical protein
MPGHGLHGFEHARLRNTSCLDLLADHALAGLPGFNRFRHIGWQREAHNEQAKEENERIYYFGPHTHLASSSRATTCDGRKKKNPNRLENNLGTIYSIEGAGL